MRICLGGGSGRVCAHFGLTAAGHSHPVFGRRRQRVRPAPGLRPGLLLLGPAVLWAGGVYSARQQEHAADAAASGQLQPIEP